MTSGRTASTAEAATSVGTTSPIELPHDLAWLGALFDLSPIAIAVSRNGTIERVNRRYAEMFGVPDPVSVVGRPFLSCLAPEEQARGAEILRDLRPHAAVTTAARSAAPIPGTRMTAPARETFLALRSDGLRFPCSVEFMRVADEHGDVTLAFASDLTDTLEATGPLQDHAARLARAQDVAEFGTWDFDLETGWMRISPNVEAMTGVPMETAPLFPALLATTNPEDAETLQAALRHTAETGEPADLTCRIRNIRTRRMHHIRVRAARAGHGLLTGSVLDLTDQVQLREQLERAQEIANLGSWDWDIVTNDLAWSDEIYRIFGLQPQEFGASYPAFLERVHPEDRAAVAEAVDTALREQTRYSIQHRLLRPDGSERIVLEQGEAIYADDGAPLRMIGTVHDITGRVLAERSATERARQLEHVAATVPIILSVADMDGTIRISLGRALEGLGQRPGQTVGLNVFQLYAGSEEILDTYRRAAAGEVVTTRAEVRGRVLEGTLQVLRDDAGTPTGYVSASFDVTELVATERALRASEGAKQAILDAILDPILIVNADGTIADGNEALIRDLGAASIGELAGRPAVEFFPTIDAPTSLVHRAMETRERIGGEVEVGDRTFDVSAFPVFDGDRTARVVLVRRDVTERAEARRRTEASLREKEMLLREIHHRVKNNLQVVGSLLYFESKKAADEHARALFAEARDRINSMAMVHDLLYRSPDLGHIDLAQYVRALVDQVRHSIGAAKLELTVNAANVGLPAEAAFPCGMAIGELVANAARHAYPGEAVGRIGVTVEARDRRVSITVADDGIGMPQEVLDGARSGFGVALVRQLAEQLSGTVRFVAGDGTRVTLEFPIIEPLRDPS